MMVFGRDMFFPTRYVAAKTRMIVHKQRQNCTHIRHDYKVGDKVLIRRDIGGEILPKMGRYAYGPLSGHKYLSLVPTVEILRSDLYERRNQYPPRLLPYFKFQCSD
jgi:hypothetical protein